MKSGLGGNKHPVTKFYTQSSVSEGNDKPSDQNKISNVRMWLGTTTLGASVDTELEANGDLAQNVSYKSSKERITAVADKNSWKRIGLKGNALMSEGTDQRVRSQSVTSPACTQPYNMPLSPSASKSSRKVSPVSTSSSHKYVLTKNHDSEESESVRRANGVGAGMDSPLLNRSSIGSTKSLLVQSNRRPLAIDSNQVHRVYTQPEIKPDAMNGSLSANSLRGRKSIRSNTKVPVTTKRENDSGRLSPIVPMKFITSPRVNGCGRYLISDFELGGGEYSKVYKAQHVLTGETVACKIVNKRRMKDSVRRRLSREIEVLKLLDHPNIIRMYETLETEDDIYFFLLYARGGEMYTDLAQKGKMDEKQARKTFRSILSAVEYCHFMGIAHRDLKVENILYGNDRTVLVSDFGLSNYFIKGTMFETFCGSHGCAAPEVLVGRPYSGPEADVWSLGVLLYVMIEGTVPFATTADSAAAKFDTRFMLKSCRKFIKEILKPEPRTRPNASALMRLEWVNEGCTPLEPYRNHTNKLEENLDEDVVQRMIVAFKLSRRRIVKAIAANAYDNVMATYNILLDKKRKDINRFKVENAKYQQMMEE
eukprot:CFRG7758T1